MKSFLCRVMVFVFLFNCLTPAVGWGQTARRSAQPNPEALGAQVSRQVAKAIQSAFSPKTPAGQFARADKEARRAHQKRFAQADAANRQQAANLTEDLDLRRMAAPVEQPSSLYVAPRPHTGPVILTTRTKANAFLEKIKNNQIEFADLIDYADPLDTGETSRDLLTTAYAAEIIGNQVTMAAQAEFPIQLGHAQYDLNAFQAQLVKIQARLLYRMALLGAKVPSYTANTDEEPSSAAYKGLQNSFQPSKERTQALNSLRIALLRIHKFYRAKGMQDPVDEYQKEKEIENPHPGLLEIRFQSGSARTRATEWVKYNGNLAVFMSQLIQEFKQILKQDPEEGGFAYQHLQIAAEYATVYALEYRPEELKRLIKLLDEGPKETDFKQKYTPIVNAIFISVFENTRYSTMNEASTQKVLNLLKEFSDPEKYSLSTRVLALEAASLLFRPFNKEPVENNKPESESTSFFPMNLTLPDDNLRPLFAYRTAELYCPLIDETSTSASHVGDHGMEDYGLSSEEMQALADKLGYIYDGFYDIHTEQLTADGQPSVFANYPGMSLCPISMKNEPNKLKVGRERATAFVDFTKEVLFWIYGYKAFSLVGTAFRLTRGAVIASPQALRAYKAASSGGRMAAFNAKIQEGARFANWVYKNKKQQGYLIEAAVQKAPARVEKEVVVENGVSKTVERKIPAVTEFKPINHTYQLQGQYSHWNPKRWLGMTPAEDIVGYRVTRMEPGLKTTVGTMQFDKPIDGLHNLQELSQMTRQLKLADGSRFWFEKQPYWRGMLNIGQVQQERWTLAGLENAFKDQMDIWIPLEKVAQETGKIGETTRWWNVSQWGVPEKWGELVEANMWGKPGVGGASSIMPMYVAPKSSLRFIWGGSAKQLIAKPEGVVNISERLPGFFTRAEDMASGNVYNQMFNAYMKPLNWKSTVAKTFLPDYVPTKTFWQSVRANPVLGMKLAPQLLWRNQFGIAVAGLGAWYGADYLAYPVLQSWMEKEATKDVQAEIDKYGDTFSPEQAKKDELLMEEMGIDRSDTRAMTTYNAVLAAQPQESAGALFSAPVVVTRRALGMPFIGEGLKEDYAYQASRVDLNRALLRQRYAQFQENKPAMEQWRQEQREMIEQDQQALLELYAPALEAAPQLKEEVNRIYKNYEDGFLNAPTDAVAMQASERFNQQMDKWQLKAQMWASAKVYAEQKIEEFKMMFHVQVTPEVEQTIYEAYYTYAQQYCEALEAQDSQAQINKASRKLNKTLEKLFNKLYGSIEYGVDFNPHAAE